MAAVPISDLPAGSTITVYKTGGVWPARPTTRTDVTVVWTGALPAPAIVGSGTGGAYNGDKHDVTP